MWKKFLLKEIVEGLAPFFSLQPCRVKLHLDALKSLPDVHKIHLQRLRLQMPLFYLILSTSELYSYQNICLNQYRATVSFLDHWKLLEAVWCYEIFRRWKNRTLMQYRLQTYLMLWSHCTLMCYFLPLENFRKIYSFRKFSGVKMEHWLNKG